MSSGPLRVLVLSDTHAPRFWKGVPEGLRDPLSVADVILHAGDVCTAGVLDELAAHAPVHVVRGNNDGDDVAAWNGADGGDARGAPETVELDLAGLTVAMIHDAGPRHGRDRRMRRRFPDAGLVVFGHSHIPLDDADGAVHLFNPGSPTEKRRQPVATYGELIIEGGSLLRHAVVPLPPRIR